MQNQITITNTYLILVGYLLFSIHHQINIFVKAPSQSPSLTLSDFSLELKDTYIITLCILFQKIIWVITTVRISVQRIVIMILREIIVLLQMAPGGMATVVIRSWTTTWTVINSIGEDLNISILLWWSKLLCKSVFIAYSFLVPYI